MARSDWELFWASCERYLQNVLDFSLSEITISDR